MRTVIKNILTTNIWLILGSGSLFVLFMQPTSIQRIISAFIISLLMMCSVAKNKNPIGQSDKYLRATAITVMVILSLNFIDFWRLPQSFLNLFAGVKLLRDIFLIISVIVLCAFSYPVVYLFLEKIRNVINRGIREYAATEKNSQKHIIGIAIIAVVTITICSKSSPIYPLNDWVDANCFFTVGKAMINGKILYRDIFEQKGPILYMLHSAAYLISNNTFLGVYFIEIVACFIFLYFSHKILILFCAGKIILLLPLLSATIYSSKAFCQGDSAEELALPLIVISLYLCISAVLKRNTLKYFESLIIGITAGVVLWIKFTLVGCYLGLILAISIIYIKNSWYKELFESILFCVFGVIIASVPTMIYFSLNHAIYDLFDVYFYKNIFMYSSGAYKNIFVSMYDNIKQGWTVYRNAYLSGMVLMMLGIAYFGVKKHLDLCFIFGISVLSAFFLVFIGGRHYQYYPFIFSVFVPFGFVFIYEIINGIILMRINNKGKVFNLFVFILSTVFSVVILISTPNMELLKYHKQDMPQYRFNNIILKSENPTLLNYGFLDGGFYTVSNIVPNCKFFCRLNIPYDKVTKEQDRYINEGLVEFVVTRNKKISSKRYTLVDSCDFVTEGTDCTYYLYKLK